VENSNLEVDLETAHRINDEAIIGDLVETPLSLRSFRRIGIQAVKQHIVQRVRDMERNIQLDRFVGKEGQIITGTVSRITSNGILINLDRIDGIMPNSERIPGEKHGIGKRIKVIILEVRTAVKDSDIILSRSHPDFVKLLFQLEVPEIAQNIVQIKGIVREAGYRTKMAVFSTQDKVDPVGACVGYKGSRVKNIVNELNGEKIDIIPWDDDPAQYIAHALSPAQVISVEIFDDHSAEVIVPDNQLSLAIGKQGQNARLANKLTGWKIDILSEVEKEKLMQELRMAEIYSTPLESTRIPTRVTNILKEAGMTHVYHLVCMTEAEAGGTPGLGEKSIEEIKEYLAEVSCAFLKEGEEKPAMPQALSPEEEEPEAGTGEADEDAGAEDAEAESEDESEEEEGEGEETIVEEEAEESEEGREEE
jgi:transcription termination/antitermination protein NusA